MSNPFDKLSRQVLDEVARQRQTSPDRLPESKARVFGLFLQECLRNLGYTRAEFAQALDLEPDLADAILEGILPASELDSALLEAIGHLVNYEARTLSILLHSSPASLRSNSQTDSHSSIPPRGKSSPAQRGGQ
jgi:hypothetical protein